MKKLWNMLEKIRFVNDLFLYLFFLVFELMVSQERLTNMREKISTNHQYWE
jgi:hypothetical protein